MAEDQATLFRFAEEGSEQADDRQENTGRGEADHPADGERADSASTIEAGDREPVCPWCLAPASAFEDGGPTGTSCGRCSAALPVDADWFLAGEVVARRPMYGVDEAE